MGEFEGTFCPPMLGTSVPPIRVTGPGSCEISEEGLTVHGHMASQGGGRGGDLLRLFGVAVAFVAVLTLVVGLTVLVAPKVNVLLVVIPLAAIGAAVYRATYRGEGFTLGDGKPPATRISRTILWAAVGKFYPDPEAPGTVVVHVHDFGGARGTLHFRPARSVAPLLAAMHHHGARMPT